MKTAIIVQARMSSTRLPGKVLKTVLGKSLLEYMIERVNRSKESDDIIIATTHDKKDDPIVELCQKLGVAYYRGSEENVLARYYEAAKFFNVDLVVRATSDCPLIDPFIVDKIISFYRENDTKFDYVSNTLIRSYPRGMDAEIVPFKILEKAFKEAENHTDKEHVTPFIYRQPDRFRIGQVTSEIDYSHYRWTVDTPEDFELIEKILKSIYPINPNFIQEDCLEILRVNPHWSLINSQVRQKAYWE